MKTLSGPMAAQRALAVHSPRTLVRIDLTGDGGEWGFYSDQPITIESIDYLPYVESISDISGSLDLVKLGSTDDIEIVMKNSDDAKFVTTAINYKIEGKDIRVQLWFPGLSALTDAITIFRGHINSIREHSTGGTVLNCVEFGKKYFTELPLREINYEEFPWDFPPESTGAKIPMVYGKLANAKGIAIWGHASTKLHVSHGEAEETILVESVEGFPPSGAALIGMEQIYFRGIDLEYEYEGETIGALLDCTRGHDGTDPAPHKEGSAVSLAREHIYIFADHGCKLISPPLVNGAKPIDPYTRYTASTRFARIYWGVELRTCLVEFDASPARYLQVGEGVDRMAVVPDTVAEDNQATDAENAIKPVEDSTYAELAYGSTPLKVTNTVDVSANEYSRGPIKKARVAVEFEIDSDFDLGEIQVEVV